MTVLFFFLAPVLFPLSCVYVFFLWMIRFFYSRNIIKSYRPGACVVSVGNITLGGSGKTPLVAYLADYFSRHFHVAILLRGYMKPKTLQSLGSHDYYAFGDEASMLRQDLNENCRVISGKNRVESARLLDSEKSTGVIILDDGFQHWKLRRDLDIVIIDATNPFGNRLLLPAGPLREGLDSLKRADCFCLSRCDEIRPEELDRLGRFLRAKNPKALLVKAVHAPEALRHLKTNTLCALDVVKGRKIGLFCGIANPASFVRSMERLGADIIIKKFFADHHEYNRQEIESLMKLCKAYDISTMVTTEKDAQRLAGFFAQAEMGVDVLALRIKIKIIEGQEALYERLDSLRSI